MAKNQWQSFRQVFRLIGDFSTIGLQLVISTCLGLAAGFYLDRWLRTQPILTLVFLVLGIAAGFINIFRTLQRIPRQKRNDREDEDRD
ncbi:MAG: AtpZ/AtpI family protein [Candidatus Tectomicrobia bacterium]|nr:AtpZ/AtpI family protein [Candidatus Tectomicrobia bacterium]